MKMLLRAIECCDIVETGYEMLADVAAEATLSNEKKSIAEKLSK